MRTRRFKALNGLNGKYAAVVEKIAIYNSKGNQIDCCIIQKDKEGREYYYPSNFKNKFGSFTNRPKDAIECIRKGFGDALVVNNLFVRTEHVVRFIDREYGEQLRKQTIEGWKNATFKYGIIVYTDTNDYKLYEGMKAFGDKLIIFNSEKEAEEFIKKIKNKIDNYYNEYYNLQDRGDCDGIEQFFEKIKYTIFEYIILSETKNINIKIIQVVDKK